MKKLRKLLTLPLLFWVLLLPSVARAENQVAAKPARVKRVRVFVALCDNASQGIVPVPARIGDGEKPSENLYWGCDDGLKTVFTKSSRWKLVARERAGEAGWSADAETLAATLPADNPVLERLFFRHASGEMELTATAYRGREIARCLRDFEAELNVGYADLVAYIGHNVLMDGDIPLPEHIDTTTMRTMRIQGGDNNAIVLCCKSRAYFESRLSWLSARPVLLTEQLMYPGAFILRDVLEVWHRGGSLTEIRNAAGAAYARNQKISESAARGVFSKLKE